MSNQSIQPGPSRTGTIAGAGPPRSLRRTATAIQGLSPDYFPFLMATSIISTGTFLPACSRDRMTRSSAT
jgi:hypothetical protein